MERLNKSYGFSLIEMIVVILIMVILAITAYFKWSQYAIALSAQTIQLADDVRYTQNLAMSQNQRFRLAITSSTTYQIQNGSGTAVAKPLCSSTTINLTNGVIFGTTTGITSKITFNNQGVPYADSSTTPLATTAIIPLTASGTTMNVTIDPTTGRVTP